MMHLALMRDLVAEAEEGDRAMPTAHAAAGCWGFDPGTLVEWRYSANAIFRFAQDGSHRFLRLTPCSERGAEQIQAELDFVLYLADNGIPAARPLPSQTGKLTERISFPHGGFTAVVFEEAPGRPLELDEMDPSMIRLWGRGLGEIHLLSEAYRPHPQRQRRSWREDLALARGWLPEEENVAHELLEQLLTWLEKLPAGSQDLGLIHYDFELDNLPWDGRRFHIIDFHDAAYYWYAADVAFALDDVREQPDQRQKAITNEFIAGYRQVRFLDLNWGETLPTLFLLMDLLKYTRVLAAFSDTDPTLDPPWLAKLRIRIERWLEAKQAAFGRALHETYAWRQGK